MQTRDILAEHCHLDAVVHRNPLTSLSGLIGHCTLPSRHLPSRHPTSDVAGSTMQQNTFRHLFSVSTLYPGRRRPWYAVGADHLRRMCRHRACGRRRGINLLDLAPRYGDGKAEQVVGEAFAASCRPASASPASATSGTHRPATSRGSCAGRSRQSQPAAPVAAGRVLPALECGAGWAFMAGRRDAASRMTPYPASSRMSVRSSNGWSAEGLIGTWGLTGIGHPDTIIGC